MVDDDEWQATVATSRALLETPDPEFQRRNPLDEDVLSRWRRGRPQPEPTPRPRQAGPSAREVAWMDGHLDIARKEFAKKLAFQRKFSRDLLIEVLKLERKRHGDELAKLEARIAAMETTIERGRGTNDAQVLEWPIVRKHDAG